MGTPERFSTFLGQLKKVRNGQQLAQYVKLPLKVNLNSKTFEIKTAKGLSTHYKQIMSEKVRSYIYYSEPKKLFCSRDGLMLGKGHVWVKLIKDQYKIVALNP